MPTACRLRNLGQARRGFRMGPAIVRTRGLCREPSPAPVLNPAFADRGRCSRDRCRTTPRVAFRPTARPRSMSLTLRLRRADKASQATGLVVRQAVPEPVLVEAQTVGTQMAPQCPVSLAVDEGHEPVRVDGFADLGRCRLGEDRIGRRGSLLDRPQAAINGDDQVIDIRSRNEIVRYVAVAMALVSSMRDLSRSPRRCGLLGFPWLGGSD